MIRLIAEYFIKFIKLIMYYDDKHPYVSSFILAIIITLYFLFRIPFIETAEDTIVLTQEMIIVNIDKIQAPRRIVKKEISIEESEVATKNTNIIERAVGISEDASAVDIAFFPNIAPPRPVGRLKKRYPKIAREMNIEAVINIELLISKDGKVRNVKILGIRLSKALPAELHSEIAGLFSKDAIKILLGTQFTPPIISGKRVPIKMEMPLRFRLE